MYADGELGPQERWLMKRLLNWSIGPMVRASTLKSEAYSTTGAQGRRIVSRLINGGETRAHEMMVKIFAVIMTDNESVASEIYPYMRARTRAHLHPSAFTGQYLDATGLSWDDFNSWARRSMSGHLWPVEIVQHTLSCAILLMLADYRGAPRDHVIDCGLCGPQQIGSLQTPIETYPARSAALQRKVVYVWYIFFLLFATLHDTYIYDIYFKYNNNII